MGIKIQNLRIKPYSDKDGIKVIFGDELHLSFEITHVDGESYLCALDNERILYPVNRPVCAYSEVFTRDGDDVNFTLKLNTSKLRDYVSSIRKPMPVYLQIVRVVNGKYETVLLDDILAIPSVIDGSMTVYEGDPLRNLIDGKMDIPEQEGTAGQVLTMDADGHYTWQDLPIQAQVQSDWDCSDSESAAYILNKPQLATVATSGSYNDLTDKPVIPEQAQADWDESDSSATSYIKNKPVIPDAQVQSDWDESDSSKVDFIKNKPALATVATSGSYNDLSNKPVIVAPVNADWDESSSEELSYILNKPNLATVATSGSYNDLSNKPTIPASQVQADYDQSDSSAVDYIKNKPDLSTKLDAPTTAGTAGQLLKKTATGQEWADSVDEDTLDALDDMITMLETHSSSDPLPYFHIVSLVDGNTISLTTQSNWSKTGGTPSLEVSIDKDNWVSFNPKTENFNVTLGAGDTLWMRGDNTNIANNRFINATGNFKLGGKMTSLLSKTIDTTQTITYMPKFKEITQLVGFMDDFEYPYGVTTIENAFQGCSGLTMLPPIFPSTVSYPFRAFEGCTNVTSLPEGYTIPEACAGVNYALYLTFKNVPFTKVPDGFKIPSGCATSGTFSGNRVTEIGNNVEFLNDETWGDGAFPIYNVTKIGDNFKIRNVNVTETNPFVLFPNLTSLGTNCDINGTITNPA